MARERDLPPHAAGQDRLRNGREMGSGRERRRLGGYEDGEEEEEWENVPKSPESERRNRAGHLADSATDWRRAGAGKLPGKASQMKERGGRKSSFPAWMAEESEPSWMNEGQDDGSYQMGGRDGGGGGGRGHDGSSRRQAMGDDDDVDVDVTGMDSIQAFKAQMKEREKRERERNQGSSSALTAGPPPGLEKRGEMEDQDSKTDGMAALQSVGMNQQEKTAAALFDNFASSAKQRQQEKQQQQQQHQSYEQLTSPSDAAAAAAIIADTFGADQVVLPGRSSRFARFFDGKPQAAALAAQQRQMEATHRNAAEQSPSSTIKQSNNDQSGGDAMAELFKGLSTDRSNVHETKEKSGPASPPGLQRNPSEADVQSMQKIMALLGGGGGPQKGHENNRSPQPPGPPPSLPPGINLGSGGGSQNHSEQASHPSQQSGQTHSPNSAYRHAPQQQQQQHPQGSWANAVSNPGQPFDPHAFGGSPPGPGQQGPPFRPPFGIDPRLLNRGPPPPQAIPPQFSAAAMSGMPPIRGISGNFGMPPFGPGIRPPPPPPLPPQLQQHMMTLPPQAQHQLLMQHFQHHASNVPPFNGPPQQQHHLASPPGQHHQGGNGNSPLPPFLSPSPAATSNANQSAQLMALLGQGPGPASSKQ